MTRGADLTDQVDGATSTFTLPQEIVPGTLEVYLNGVRQRRGEFFTELSPTLFSTTAAPKAGDALAVQYETVGPGETLVFPVVVASGSRPGA